MNNIFIQNQNFQCFYFYTSKTTNQKLKLIKTQNNSNLSFWSSMKSAIKSSQTKKYCIIQTQSYLPVLNENVQEFYSKKLCKSMPNQFDILILSYFSNKNEKMSILDSNLLKLNSSVPDSNLFIVNSSIFNQILAFKKTNKQGFFQFLSESNKNILLHTPNFSK